MGWICPRGAGGVLGRTDAEEDEEDEEDLTDGDDGEGDGGEDLVLVSVLKIDLSYIFSF